MEREWHKIISFNGSQANAFEELICQVAMAEEYSKFSHFERVGTPDGGVECYWQLKNGTEWGWQAKYYEHLDSSEWNGIKKSLFDAVQTHPTLEKYFICIPHNLTDGRRGRISQKDRWEKYKREWVDELSNKGKIITLEIWNSSTLLSKLLLNKNSGIKSFFFNDIEIKEDQLDLLLDAAILNLGPKYSPDLNFSLDFLPTAFDALSRNARFQENFKNRLDSTLQKLNDVISSSSRFEETKHFSETLKMKSSDIIVIYETTDFSPLGSIPISSYLALFDAINTELKLIRTVYDKIESDYQDELKKKAESNPSKDEYYGTRDQKTNREVENIYQYLNSADEMIRYLTGPVIKGANEGVLFLTGKPGSGKSHLLADIASNRKSQHIPTILLLGEHFPNMSPKVFIQQSLCPTSTLENYLGALESLAKAKQSRILFMIDAINEGMGKYIWKSNIAGLVKELKRFQWIGFVFSYRSTYKNVVIPDSFTPPTIRHNGFEGIEYEATKKFFEYYKIQQPTIPLLNPEFSNPLFLKTFCVALNKSGKTVIPEGYEGISRILDEYIGAINKNIGDRLHYPYQRINLVSKAIDEIIKHQIESGVYTVPWETAFSLIEPLLKQYSNKSGLLEELIKEGLFIEDYFYSPISGKHEQHGVVFNYERFNEHLRTIHVLANYSSKESIKKDFAKNGKLRSLFFDEIGFSDLNAGLLNAFAIVLPEKFNVEIYEVFKTKDSWAQLAIYESFLQSLIWRRHDTIKPKSWDFIKKHINSNEERLIAFFDTIFLLTANPTHYFNGDFVHNLLKPFDMAKRDYVWSLTIDKLWQRHDKNSIKRIIDWCWSEEEKGYTKDDSVLLLGKILAWLFTSSNRHIRDNSTKAFASLFINRTFLLKNFISEFKSVNDPYVLERVIAGAYGAVTHSRDLASNTTLAQYIYDTFFRDRKPPLNVLTRDYCRGIIDFATSSGGKIDYEKTNLYPPFDFIFPKDIPGKDWAKKVKVEKKGKLTDEELGQSQISHSVLHWDFARYILGTNHGNSIPFTSYTIKSRKSYEFLQKKLRGYKKKFFETFVSSKSMGNNTSALGKKVRRLYHGKELENFLTETKKYTDIAYNYLKEKLSKEEFLLFEEAQSFIDVGFETEKYKRARFDVEVVQYYILHRVFDLGWTKEYFGRYDSKVDERYRRADKSERIGKKYQWIAYYEIMALLCDNYDFIARFDDESSPYIGTWQYNFRNIDPTSLNKQSSEENNDGEHWWVQESYSNWEEDRETWLSHLTDLPNLEKIITVNDENGVSWYLLYDMINWRSKKPIGKERYRSERKEFWISMTAFLVSKKDKSTFLNIADKKLLWLNTNIPENPYYYDIFLGELYHSDSYTEHMSGYFDTYPYRSFSLDGPIINVIHTVEDYRFESEYDLSEFKSKIHKPSKFLFDLLNGNSGKNDSCVYDSEGNVMIYDPGAHMKQRNGCLLINKEVLDACLKENGLELIWVFCGEKEDIGQNTSYVFRMLFSGVCAFQKGKFTFPLYHEEEKYK